MEACLSGELSLEEMHVELAAVADGIRLIATITNDLLDLQKMRAGEFSVRMKAARTRLLVDASVRAVQPAVSVPIGVSIDDSVPEWVRAESAGARTTCTLICCGSEVP
jgi:hypothetical protein